MRLSDLFIGAFILLCVLAAVCMHFHSAKLLPFECIRVVDGDTIVGRDEASGEEFRIRLSGIDAPESAFESGQIAKEFLKRMIEGRWAICKLQGEDMYKRKLCDVVLNGESVNLAMLSAGMSVPYVYSRFTSYQEKQVYLINYSKALKEKRGLWREFILTNPYRQRKLMRS